MSTLDGGARLADIAGVLGTLTVLIIGSTPARHSRHIR